MGLKRKGNTKNVSDIEQNVQNAVGTWMCREEEVASLVSWKES